jgi:NADH:ubiquinone oxidoreductase subunit 5 (subunit L)/multisubunit Na+/H+ antiporter MnhA subunit
MLIRCSAIPLPGLWLVSQAISFGIMIDNLAAVMLVVVTLVSLLVHLFRWDI